MNLRDGARNAGLVGLSVLLALSIGEVFCRVAGLGPGFFELTVDGYRVSPNRNLGFEPKPGVGRYNSEGYIGPVYGEKAGKTRVAFIGDSVTYGILVPLEKTFVHLLEGRYRDRLQIMSFAVPGYDLNQYVETFETKVRRFQPDLVVFGICFNDLFFSSQEYQELLNAQAEQTRFLQEFGQAAGWLARAPLHSQLYRFVRYSLFDRAPASHEGVPLVRLRQLVLRLQRAQSRVPMRFVLLPVTSDRYPEPLSTMRAAFVEAGFAVRDLNSEFHSDPALRPLDSYFLDDQHLNEKGHLLVFDALAKDFDHLGQR